MERRFIENKLVYKDNSKTILNGINIERLDNLKNITNDIPYGIFFYWKLVCERC